MSMTALETEIAHHCFSMQAGSSVNGTLYVVFVLSQIGDGRASLTDTPPRPKSPIKPRSKEAQEPLLGPSRKSKNLGKNRSTNVHLTRHRGVTPMDDLRSTPCSSEPNDGPTILPELLRPVRSVSTNGCRATQGSKMFGC